MTGISSFFLSNSEGSFACHKEQCITRLPKGGQWQRKRIFLGTMAMDLAICSQRCTNAAANICLQALWMLA
jgi:hypothetical protein